MKPQSNQHQLDSPAGNLPEPALLILADISGFTRYMTANAKTLAHSHTVITELIQAIVRQIQLPLQVIEVEGDAVFLYCPKRKGNSWPATKRVVGASVLEFFSLFAEKLAELSQSNTCSCHACSRIETLRLKVIVHSGEVLVHRVLNFARLAGVDVIIAHRLLKNSVNADQYLLLTRAARQDVEFPVPIEFAEGVETYDDIGQVNTLIYLPGGGSKEGRSTPTPSFAERVRQSWNLFWKLWFAPFIRRAGRFNHVTTTTGAAGRVLFAVLTLLLTPIFLPVGGVFILLHALKPPKKVRHASDCREHKADGSCCH